MARYIFPHLGIQCIHIVQRKWRHFRSADGVKSWKFYCNKFGKQERLFVSNLSQWQVENTVNGTATT